jgi:DNA-binding YbaB/EbfC family protein
MSEMKNLGEMLRKAQEMQGKMGEMQEQLSRLEVDGVAGAGLVQVTLNGKSEMRDLKIDPSLMIVDEVEVLQDLIKAAHQDAKTKCEELVKEEMAKLTGGLPLPPGFSLPI